VSVYVEFLNTKW